ncbi:MAG TPA: ATP-binding cassette domain-containing protein [Arthrobacter sp.]
MAERSTPALAAGIDKFTYPGDAAPVLDGVVLSLAAGTLTAVLGGSGSGKSTLGRLLAGWLVPGTGGTLSGFLDLGGTRLRFTGGAADPRIDPAAWGRRVGFVPQDAAAALSTVRATVAEELAFGLENAGVERAAMEDAVRRTASQTGLAHLLDKDPATLSGGQLRRLAIGCAVVSGPAVLVMDEPLASLDRSGAENLADLVRNLVKDGTAVVVLSQRADELLFDADTWLLLEGGTVALAGTPAEVSAAGVLETSGVVCPRPSAGSKGLPPGCAAPVSGPAALELRDVSFAYGRRQRRAWVTSVSEAAGAPVLDGLSLSVAAGEIVAVTGANGAGKSTLLRHLNGLLQPTAGSLLVNGRNVGGQPAGRVSGEVGLLFQQPRDQLFERTVEREVRFGLDRQHRRTAAPGRATPNHHRAAADAAAHQALDAVGLEHLAGRHPAELPASQQRLLALATVLARRPAVLALDEPTVALDGHGLATLGRVVRGAAAEGTAVVLVTHDLDYARSIAHRTVHLDSGRLLTAG